MAMENGHAATIGELYLTVLFQETINTNNKNILYPIDNISLLVSLTPPSKY